MNVSIKDIAKASGFSVSAVSYALRNNPKISKATRIKIHKVAEKLGYHHDPAMSQFMSYLRERRDHPITRALAFLNTSPKRHWPEMGVRATHIWESMTERAAHYGYHLDEIWIGDLGKKPSALPRILEARGIQGLVVHFSRDIKTLPTLPSDNVAIVCFDHYPLDHPMHNVAHSNFRGMRMAVRELRRLGYQRIGLATDNPSGGISRDQWVASFLFEHEIAVGTKPIPLYLGRAPNGNTRKKRGSSETMPDPRVIERESFLKWVERARPDCVITYMFPCLQWLREAGHRVPEDIGFCLLDWAPEHGDVAGVDQDIEAIATTTIDTVIAHVESNRTGVPDNPVHIRINGTWHPGGTVRKLIPTK